MDLFVLKDVSRTILTISFDIVLYTYIYILPYLWDITSYI